MSMQEVREQNIALVTQTALACFVENGIEKTTIRDIAHRAGLTERSVYRYFAGKDELVIAAAYLYWDRAKELAAQSLAKQRRRGMTGIEEIRVLLRSSFGIADQRCRRYICLHAAFPSACARLTATYQTCVSEFGTACMCALKHLSIENNSTAHTSSKSQQNRIFCILRRTGFYFTQSRTVCIIGNCNRTGKVLL